MVLMFRLITRFQRIRHWVGPEQFDRIGAFLARNRRPAAGRFPFCADRAGRSGRADLDRPAVGQPCDHKGIIVR